MQKIIGIVMGVLLISVLIFFAARQDNTAEWEKGASQITAPASTIQVETPVFTKEVPLVVDVVTGYLNASTTMDADQIYYQFYSQLKNSDIAVPLEFAYDVWGLTSNVKVKKGTLEVAEKGDFSKAISYPLIGSKGEVEIYNLKTGTQYQYRVNFTLSNNKTVGKNGEFKTQAGLRWIKIDGIKNVRDIGGWKTVTGGTVKQGLLYRGIELDGASESSYRITSEGLKVMLEILNIQYDMDLRTPVENGTNVDALGSDVIHQYYPIPQYSGVFHHNYTGILRDIFSDLSNKENYPVYMHCTYGRDRTGTVCYLLEGLLGVSKEDATRDYELTAFSGLGIDKETFSKLQSTVDGFEGDTFQQKVENYLISIGVTSQEIDAIQEIFLGE